MSDGGLDFERAAYTEGAGGGAPCANCRNPLGHQYWTWQQQMLCARCRDGVASLLVASQSSAAFGKAALLGSGVAIACGIGYAVFVAVTKIQLALITIGIAFVIAKVLRKASGGIGGRRYQILAVALTYFASAMGYAPAVLNAVSKTSEAAPSTSVAPSPSAAPTSSDENAAPAAAAPAKPHQEKPAGGLGLALLLLIGITLASPVLAATEAPFGLLIVIFGLWEAWKLSKGLALTIDGPFKSGPEPTGPPA